MAPLAQIWSFLRSVTSLRFEAHSELATEWNGSGAGSVTVSEPEAGVLVFNEAGTWQSSGRELHFTNVFRWSDSGDVLRLEHLRFGKDNPVFLFDMAQNAVGEWREVSPHMCRDDCYTASLGIEGSKLLVAWSIVGPAKRESIKYVYW